MRKKVLVLGSTGMLGHMVLKVLSEDEKLDVLGTHIDNPQDPFYFRIEQGINKLERMFEHTGEIHYTINCIGITANKIRLEHPNSVINAIRVNSIFPYELAELAQQQNMRVIHMSTDGVFGNIHEHCFEDTPTDCLDTYGKTKNLGEVFCDNVINIRCSILGPSPYLQEGLYEWFMSQSEGSEVPGFTNHHWNGVTTLQFGMLCRSIIKNEWFDKLKNISSVFHFVPNKAVTKYELLSLLRHALNKNVTISPVEGREEVKRLLSSRYDILDMLCGHNTPMKDAVQQLIDFHNKS